MACHCCLAGGFAYLCFPNTGAVDYKATILPVVQAVCLRRRERVPVKLRPLLRRHRYRPGQAPNAHDAIPEVDIER